MTDVKLQLLTIVFPVLLYAAETWTVNKEDEKDYLHLYYRRILAVKWQDRRTNEEIRAVQRKETVVGTFRMRKLQVFGHICSMSDDRLLKTLLLGMDEGERRPAVA